MEDVEAVKGKDKRRERRPGKRYGFEVKLRCVKLRLEEGFPISLITKELRASRCVISRWIQAFQEKGEAGLQQTPTKLLLLESSNNPRMLLVDPRGHKLEPYSYLESVSFPLCL